MDLDHAKRIIEAMQPIAGLFGLDQIQSTNGIAKAPIQVEYSPEPIKHPRRINFGNDPTRTNDAKNATRFLHRRRQEKNSF